MMDIVKAPIWSNGEWAVTWYGLERAVAPVYEIAANRLGEDAETGGWPMHMSEKGWDIKLFNQAWLEALVTHDGRYRPIRNEDAISMCKKAKEKWEINRKADKEFDEWLDRRRPLKPGELRVMYPKDYDDFLRESGRRGK
jgi:hypothetical protein